MAQSNPALNKTLVPVTFDGGLDTKTAKQLVIPGKFLVLENCIRRKGGQVAKRFGFKALGKTILGGGTIAAGSKLARFRDDVLLMSQERIYSYTPADNAWIDRGQLASIVVDSEPVIRNSEIQSMPDMASAQGVTVTVWEDSRGGSRFSVVDDTTGSSILYDQVLNANAAYPKVCVVGNYFLIAYIDTVAGTLYSRRIAIANPIAITAEIAVVSTIVANKPWDMEPMSAAHGAVFALSDVPTTGIIYGYIAETGAVGSPAINGLPSTRTIVAPGRDALTVVTDQTNNFFYVFYYDASTDQLKVMASTYDFITRQFANLESSAAKPAIRNIAGCVRSDASVRFFYEFLFSGTRNTAYINTAEIAWDGLNAINVGAPELFVRSVGLASKPFAKGDIEYVNVAYDSTLQSTYFTIQSNGFISTRMQPGLGAGLTAKSGLTRVSMNLQGNQVFPLGVVSKLQANANLTVSSANIGLNRTTLEFNSASFNNDILGLNQHISGGIVLGYDGVSAPELGFHIFPEDIQLSAAAGSGTFPATGQYAYRVIYEWVDGKGQIHRSVPSTLAFQSIGSTTNEITLRIPTLRLTAKTGSRADVKIVIYRSDTDLDTVLYRLADADNDTTVDFVTYVDDNSDGVGLTSREILYTTGGVLENTAPPACKTIHKHKNRLFIGGLEDGNTVNFTKEHVDGEGAAFSDVLRFTVDPFGGDVTGFSTLDDKLVIFKQDRAFTVSGDGPVDTGAQNDFTLPQLVSGDVGTSNPDSVVITPLGIMFQSKKGIYLLSRELTMSYIGAPVEQFNGETITSALVIEDQNEVRFTTKAGNALIYNYHFNQWSTFTNYSAESASPGLSTYLHLKADGTVNAETPDIYEDNGGRIRMAIETGWFSFAGVQGYQRVYWVSVLGDFLSHCITSVKLAYNFENVYNQPRYFDTRTGLLQDSYGDSVYGSETPMAGKSSDVYQFRIKPKRQKCEALKIRLEDIDAVTENGGASFNLTHMAFVVGLKSGSHRLRASKTIGR